MQEELFGSLWRELMSHPRGQAASDPIGRTVNKHMSVCFHTCLHVHMCICVHLHMYSHVHMYSQVFNSYELL